MKTTLALCEGSGAGTLRAKKWLAKKRALRAEFPDENACSWLLLGTREECERNRVGKFCALHDALIAKGCKGTFPCKGCGVAVKTILALCDGCGAGTLRTRKWLARKRAHRTEFPEENTCSWLLRGTREECGRNC
ncbi:MAG: hypothetical protein AB2556_24245, partial [Candidatus Thiodiazotropha sp.]